MGPNRSNRLPENNIKFKGARTARKHGEKEPNRQGEGGGPNSQEKGGDPNRREEGKGARTAGEEGGGPEQPRTEKFMGGFDVFVSGPTRSSSGRSYGFRKY